MTSDHLKPRRWHRWAIIGIAAFFLLGALVVGSRQSFQSRAARLRPGMTKQEVFAAMGEPDRLMKLHPKEIALFAPYPFSLHALITRPVQTLGGNSLVPGTDFPAYVEFERDIATRVRLEGQEVEAPHLPDLKP